MKSIKQKQLDFLDWEFGVFFHFGIRTFYEGHRDWDGKTMDLSQKRLFLPLFHHSSNYPREYDNHLLKRQLRDA